MNKYIIRAALFLGVMTLTMNAKANTCLDHIANHVKSTTWLVLTSCQITDNDISTITDFLGAHPEIDTVRLDNNDIGAQGAKLFAQNAFRINDLDISQNHIGDNGAAAIAIMPSLEYLVADDNKIGNDGAQALANAPKLWLLSAADNQLGYKGAEALAKNTRFTEFFLDNNHVGSRGAAALAANPNLISLSLANNKVGDEGAIAIGRSTSIHQFDLTGNNITDIGAKALAKNASSCYFFLASNQIKDPGAYAFADKHNAKIFILDVSYNKLSQNAIGALENNPDIESVYSDGNVKYKSKLKKMGKNSKSLKGICGFD